MEQIEDILADLNLTGKPRITALNKIDLLLTDDRKWDEESAVQYLAGQSARGKAVMISATRCWGLAGLMELVSQQLIHPVATL